VYTELLHTAARDTAHLPAVERRLALWQQPRQLPFAACEWCVATHACSEHRRCDAQLHAAAEYDRRRRGFTQEGTDDTRACGGGGLPQRCRAAATGASVTRLGRCVGEGAK
jgi:hypothetical protein